MKSTDKLTHQEIVNALSTCLHDVMGNDISHRHMPLFINRARAVSSIVTSAHREEIMENRRTIAIAGAKDAELKTTKKLTSKNNVKGN